MRLATFKSICSFCENIGSRCCHLANMITTVVSPLAQRLFTDSRPWVTDRRGPTICVGDGGGGGQRQGARAPVAALLPPPKKNREKYLRGDYHVKFGHFFGQISRKIRVNFSGKYRKKSDILPISQARLSAEATTLIGPYSTPVCGFRQRLSIV